MSENVKTKIVKKKRINFARLLVVVLVLYILVCFIIYLYKEPIRHIEISGNRYVSDIDIIRSANLDDYPSYVSITNKKVNKLLKENPLINKVTLKHGIYFIIYIKVEENVPVFINKSTDEVCLSNGKMIPNEGKYLGLPVLLNSTTEEMRTNFASKFATVKEGVRLMVNEIEYAPSYNSKNQVIDDKRFLLSMTDKNLVYITLLKVNLLDSYLDIIATEKLKDKGTLYLDGDETRHSFKKFGDE